MKAKLDKIVKLKGQDVCTIMLTCTASEAKEIAHLQFEDEAQVFIFEDESKKPERSKRATNMLLADIIRAIQEYQRAQPDEVIDVSDAEAFMPPVGDEKPYQFNEMFHG